MPKTWQCKIGETDNVPPGGDGPMRDAVEAAYREVTGDDPAFTFSGWGAKLSESHRAVVEDREPDHLNKPVYLDPGWADADTYRPSITLEHDAARNELYIIKGEEAAGMIEGVSESAFLIIASRLDAADAEEAD